ncbi:MAG: hypothetical protein M1840_006461 [Geoglossum simile]|nr:MAG: hypothetical protein M1840_006461 [Geoglossum simile]
MFEYLWSLLGYPPAVNFIGVRIPADGSPPHLTALRTISDSSALCSIPDLRPYWGTGTPWEFRDILKLELKNQPFESCNGFYYVFWSFALDDLPTNLSVAKFPDEEYQEWCGDVFIVKVPRYGPGWRGWVEYMDMPREFLDLEIVTKGGLGRFRRDYQYTSLLY